MSETKSFCGAFFKKRPYKAYNDKKAPDLKMSEALKYYYLQLIYLWQAFAACAYPRVFKPDLPAAFRRRRS